MGRSQTRAAQAPSKAHLEVKHVQYILTKEEDDERIKRLTSKIVRFLEIARKREKLDTDNIDDALNPDFEKALGI
jgi:hypothetical protein